MWIICYYLYKGHIVINGKDNNNLLVIRKEILTLCLSSHLTYFCIFCLIVDDYTWLGFKGLNCILVVKLFTNLIFIHRATTFVLFCCILNYNYLYLLNSGF